MKNIITTLLIGLFVIGCSQDPKSKLYNEETIQEDLLEFTVKEKGLVMTYFLRESMRGIFSGDTSLVELKSMTYGDMISKQKKFINEQRIKDSLDRVEEEKRRVLFQQKQDSLLRLVEFTLVDLYEKDSYLYNNIPHVKISMKSVEGKKINSLKFTLKVFDKKGKSLGELYVSNSDSFRNQDVGTWSIDKYNDLYSVLTGSEINDYSYGFEIRSMIYDGELIELE